MKNITIGKNDYTNVSAINAKETGTENYAKFYDTSAANVSADDITEGKIAYSVDGKIVGTHVDGAIGEYFDTNCDVNNPSYWLRDSFILKIPEIYIEDNVTSLDSFGRNFGVAADIKISGGDNVTKMSYMFSSANSLKSVDLSGLKTDKVTEMAYMFQGCGGLTNLNLDNLNTSLITSMWSMFDGCISLTELDLSHFDTSNVTNMRQIFGSCQELEQLNIKNWNTSKVTLMRNMFQNCYALTKLDLSHFDVSQVTNMQSMFYACTALTELNLSNWQPMDTVDTNSMLYNCSGLTKLIIDSPVVFPIKGISDINNSGITKGICNIYVPDDLVEAYKSHSVWGLYSEQIKGMSELPTE